jgi:hypothetical protein
MFDDELLEDEEIIEENGENEDENLDLPVEESENVKTARSIIKWLTGWVLTDYSTKIEIEDSEHDVTVATIEDMLEEAKVSVARLLKIKDINEFNYDNDLIIRKATNKFCAGLLWNTKLYTRSVKSAADRTKLPETWGDWLMRWALDDLEYLIPDEEEEEEANKHRYMGRSTFVLDED